MSLTCVREWRFIRFICCYIIACCVWVYTVVYDLYYLCSCCVVCCVVFEPTHRLVLEPTHRSGHINDWLIVRESDNLVSSVSVTNQLESDHKAVLACLNLSKPLQNSRLVTRRKLKTINKNKFGSDAAHRLSFIPPSSHPASHYNSALFQLLHGHACTRHHTSPAQQSVRTLIHA